MNLLLAFIGIVAFVGSVLYAGFSLVNKEETEKKGSLVLSRKGALKGVGAVIGALFLWYILSSAVIIESGDRGVIFNAFTGVNLDNILGEGFHIVPKVVNRVTIYDVYTRTWTESVDCLSSDGLPITMDVSIRYRLNEAQAANVKQNVGSLGDVEQKILIPTARSNMRDVVAKFSAKEVYATKREEVQLKYKGILNKFFEKEKYLVAEDILIRKVTPPKSLTAKIAETKIAEQDVIKQANILKAEEQKKQQEIVKAQAQAEALRIKGRAVASNPKIVEIEWIEAWKHGGSQVPTVMMGGAGNVFPMMNLGDVGRKTANAIIK